MAAFNSLSSLLLTAFSVYGGKSTARSTEQLLECQPICRRLAKTDSPILCLIIGMRKRTALGMTNTPEKKKHRRELSEAIINSEDELETDTDETTAPMEMATGGTSKRKISLRLKPPKRELSEALPDSEHELERRSTVADEEGGQSPPTAVPYTYARKGLKKPSAPKNKRRRKRLNW